MGRFLGPNVAITSSGIFGAASLPLGVFIVGAANNQNPASATSGGASIRDSTGVWHPLGVAALGARGIFGAQRDGSALGRWFLSTNTGPGNGLVGLVADHATGATAVDTGIADNLSDIQQSGGLVLIGTDTNAIITSPDNATLTFTSNPAHGPGSYAINGVSANTSISFVCVGLGSGSTGICQSANGTTWANDATNYSTQPNSAVTANTVIFDGALFVSVSGSTLATSPDGITWTLTAFTHTTTANCIGYDIGNQIGNYYVGDQAGNVLVSATAAGLATAAATNISANPLRCASTTNGVALLGDNAGNIYQSSDGGVTWHTESPGLGALILTALANSVTP